MALKPLDQSPRYKKFVRERDDALEEILNKYQNGMTLLLSKLERRVEQVISHAWLSVNAMHQKKTLDHIDHALAPEFETTLHQMAYLFGKLRQTTYTLAYAGEAEAMSRALHKKHQVSLGPKDLGELFHGETPSGGHLLARTDLALSRVKRDVLDAVQLSITLESDIHETLERVRRAFPKKRSNKRPRRVLKHSLSESDTTKTKISKDVSVDLGFLDEDAWNQVVSDYLAKDLPDAFSKRSPDDQVIFFDVNPDGSVGMNERYEWEFEQELVNDFVQHVRDGQNDAATENGVEDFMWLAVIDAKTDDCCAWRDGLSSSEIEQELKKGKHSDDECDDEDVTVPPAHFNCRCQAVPMSEDLPEVTPPDYGSLDEWLTQKANE